MNERTINSMNEQEPHRALAECITQGPYKQGTRGPDGCPIVGTVSGTMICKLAHSEHHEDQVDQAEANAALILETFIVAHDTGLTPRQLCDDKAAAAKLLAKLLDYRSHAAGCAVDQTDFCTCGLAKAAESARDMIRGLRMPLGESEQLKQMGLNVRWLIGRIDDVHVALCRGQGGTWQQRAEQTVEAARKLVSTPMVADPPPGTGPIISDPTPIHRLINGLNRKCVEAAKAENMAEAKRIAELANKVEEARAELWGVSGE